MAYSNTLSESTATELLDMINSREDLKPGSKLPNENELANILKVSRGTLREAIKILSTQNILIIKRGKGTFVSDNYNTDTINTSSLNNIIVALKDLMEMRLIIEPEMAYLAATRATDKELKTILRYGSLIESKLLNGIDRLEEEQLFHISIAKAAHNDFIRKFAPIISESIYKETLIYTTQNKSFEASISDHKAIMHFIGSRNAEGAKSAMRMHILRMIEELQIDNRI